MTKADADERSTGTDVRSTLGGLRPRATQLTVVAIGVVILLLISQANAHLLSRSTLTTLTPLLGIMIIVALGQAFVIGTGGIDLSAPATITLVGAVVVQVSNGSNGRFLWALAVVALVCVAIGLLNGLLVEKVGLNALVVTLAVGQLVGGLTHLYRSELVSVIDVPTIANEWATKTIGGVSAILLVAVAGTICIAFFLNRLKYGRRLVASSAAPQAGFFAGLKVGWYRVMAYVVAALTYGVAGVLLAGWVQTPTLELGDPYLLAPIVAVVLGGAGLTGARLSPLATMLGATFIVLLDFNLRVTGQSTGVRLLAQGAILALGLTLAFVISNRDHLGRDLRSALHLSGAGKRLIPRNHE
jgi:ribose transport system permease protein